MPFDDAYFDGVFTNGSLHEWSQPEDILNEINRVLKPGGTYMISDLKRNMSPLIKWFMWAMTRSKEMRAGLLTSVAAAYIPGEAEAMLARTRLQGWSVTSNSMGLVISGRKPLDSTEQSSGQNRTQEAAVGA